MTLQLKSQAFLSSLKWYNICSKWNMDNFKFNFLAWDQLESLSLDMLPLKHIQNNTMPWCFLGNLIFAIIVWARAAEIILQHIECITYNVQSCNCTIFRILKCFYNIHVLINMPTRNNKAWFFVKFNYWNLSLKQVTCRQ